MKRFLPALAFTAAVILWGCAGTVDSVSEFFRAESWWEAAQTSDLKTRARDLESHGELALALDHWRLIHRISIDPAEADRETATLERKIARAVQSHYDSGMAALKENQMTAARNHFLAALRLNPAYQPALKQIKARFSPFPLAVYRSVTDDRPTTIAKKVFGDEEKAFLVAWFNDLPEAETLEPGTLLILPKLEKAPINKVRKTPPPDRLSGAKALLEKKDFDGALALAEKVDAGNPHLKILIHRIHLEKARVETDSGLLDAAQQSVAKVPDGFEGKNEALEKLNAILQQQQLAAAMEKARNYFDQGQYQQSIDMTEAVLATTPDRTDALELTAEARYRLALNHFDHKRFLEARTILEKADDRHEASAALKAKVHNRLKKMAQIHYRNGVKHYINEDLAAAIAEWEAALACDPDHLKAGENIENARRLMNKIKTMP